MDGGSTDNTLEILKKHGKKLKWVSKKDKGQSDAINKGLKMATGDIVAWLNSDDYYLPGTLLKVAQYFEAHREAKWLIGDYEIIDEKGKPIHGFVIGYKRLLRRFSSFGMLSFANYIIQPSTFWKREVHEEVGYLNEEYHYCMDYDFWLRIMKKYPLHLLPVPLSAFRIHGASKGGSQYEKQFDEEILAAGMNGISKNILAMHKYHNALVKGVYKFTK
jgi:glycosyltransferase involved in cell wall biosynthesis